MNPLANIFKSKASLVIVADVFSFESSAGLVGEIQKSKLRPAPLAECFQRNGCVGVALLSARKGALIHTVKLLREASIPSCLFIDPDHVGLNRLSLSEELWAYRESGASQMPLPEKILELGTSDPVRADSMAIDLRKTYGPLPIERMDPLIFPATWKDIVRAQCPELELGLMPSRTNDIAGGVSVLTRLSGKQPRFVWGAQTTTDGVRQLVELSPSLLKLDSTTRTCRKWMEAVALRPL